MTLTMKNFEIITTKKKQYETLIFGYDPDNDKLLKYNFKKN